VTGEEAVLAGEGQHPFILPMSGTIPLSTTVGTRFSSYSSGPKPSGGRRCMVTCS
jgi:hypothetical protein